MKRSFDDMKTIVEEIRSSVYPDLPRDLVMKIIDLEAQFQDEPAVASKMVGEAIREHLGKVQ